jgi:hypothetical protein
LKSNHLTKGTFEDYLPFSDSDYLLPFLIGPEPSPPLPLALSHCHCLKSEIDILLSKCDPVLIFEAR